MPVEPVVVVVLEPGRQVAEHRPYAVVVGHVVLLQLARVVDVDGELGGQVLAQVLRTRRRLHPRDRVELLDGRVGLQALPRQAAQQQVDGQVADSLQVVTSTRLRQREGTLLRGVWCTETHTTIRQTYRQADTQRDRPNGQTNRQADTQKDRVLRPIGDFSQVTTF